MQDMPLHLPAPFQFAVERMDASLFDAPKGLAIDFTSPPGAEALLPADSITWRIMKNPVALIVGGFAAVILELAEPRVRTGVWRFTNFRNDPVGRIKRTGYAAMATVYAPADAAASMIARVVEMHDRVRGKTPDGRPFHANDPELLHWVQTTASFGFTQAYARFVRPLSNTDIDRAYAEAAQGAALYGVVNGPSTAADVGAALATMTPALEASPIVLEYLDLIRTAPVLPFAPLQRLLIRGAVDLTPPAIRTRLGLDSLGLRPGEASLLRALGAVSDRLPIRNAPPAQSCLRLGLPADWLYR